MNTTPEARPAFAIGRLRLNWLMLATLLALEHCEHYSHTRPSLMKEIRKRLAAWRPLSIYRTRYAFTLFQVGQLVQREIPQRLHAQGLVIAACAHPTLTGPGRTLAQALMPFLPPFMTEEGYARLCEILTDARAGRVNVEKAHDIARRLIAEDTLSPQIAEPATPAVSPQSPPCGHKNATT
jgi:hypothetical protein